MGNLCLLSCLVSVSIKLMKNCEFLACLFEKETKTCFRICHISWQGAYKYPSQFCSYMVPCASKSRSFEGKLFRWTIYLSTFSKSHERVWMYLKKWLEIKANHCRFCYFCHCYRRQICRTDINSQLFNGVLSWNAEGHCEAPSTHLNI